MDFILLYFTLFYFITIIIVIILEYFYIHFNLSFLFWIFVLFYFISFLFYYFSLFGFIFILFCFYFMKEKKWYRKEASQGGGRNQCEAMRGQKHWTKIGGKPPHALTLFGPRYVCMWSLLLLEYSKTKHTYCPPSTTSNLHP